MNIYIFRDQGVSGFSAQNMKFSLSMALQDWSFNIRYVTAEDIRGGILSNVDKTPLFVIGGGGFTSAKKTLGPKGIQAIQNYIQSGGGYCGVCMGAYAPFRDIDFQGIEARRGQGLSVFNSLVRGHINITPAYDGTANSATVIDVNHVDLNIKSPALYWGGFDIQEDQVQELDATPLSYMTLPDNTKRILSLKKDRNSHGHPIFLSAYHFEACSRNMIRNWLENQRGNTENMRRIQNELILYPEKSYYMGLACALDHMELVKNFSFRHRVWPELLNQEDTAITSPYASPVSPQHKFNA